jgi:hypothetical protein
MIFKTVEGEFSDNCEADKKVRMAAGNQSYHAPTRIMKSQDISKSTKLKIYRTMIRPIVMYGCEGWSMSEHMEYGKERS